MRKGTALSVRGLGGSLRGLTSRSYRVIFHNRRVVRGLMDRRGVSNVAVIPSRVSAGRLLKTVSVLVASCSDVTFSFFMVGEPMVCCTCSVRRCGGREKLCFPLGRLPKAIYFGSMRLLGALDKCLHGRVCFSTSGNVSGFYGGSSKDMYKGMVR